MHLKPALRKATELGFALTAIATLILAGCGGGGGASSSGGGATTSATITPFKGPFYSGATVVLKDANGNPISLISGGTVNASGVADVTFSAGVTYPLIVEVSGSYYNENTGAAETTSMPLRGLINSASAASQVPVTIVTETAVVDLQNRLGSFAATHPIPAASAVAALSAAGTMLGVPASAVPAFNSSTHQTSDANTLRLAAWAVVANAQSGVSLAAQVNALANSLVTGAASAPVITQTIYNQAASGVWAAGTTPTAPSVPAYSYGALYASAVAAATVTCPAGQVLNPLMQCVSSGGTGGGTQTTAPALASFSPVNGLPGDTITITGTNLSGVSKVLWINALAPVNFVTQITPTTGVVEATISAQTVNSITMPVPSGLAAGMYVITAVYAGSSNAVTFAPSSAYVTFTVSSGGINTSTAASNPKGIILTSTYPNGATAATIAPMVGHYVMPEGLLTGGTSLVNNCTLDVATDGTFILAGGGYTYTASVSGKNFVYTGGSYPADWTFGVNTGAAVMNIQDGRSRDEHSGLCC